MAGPASQDHQRRVEKIKKRAGEFSVLRRKVFLEPPLLTISTLSIARKSGLNVIVSSNFSIYDLIRGTVYLF